jgi:hypothetical protein
MRNAKAEASIVVEDWKIHGISHTEQPVPSDDFGKTFPNGAWYYTRLATMWNLAPGDFMEPQGPGAERQFQVPTTAYHSTSVENGAKIAKSGGLKKGVSNSGGANGYVFVEKNGRKHLGFRYATATLCQSRPAFAKCAVFELCVDRGDTEHGIKSTVKEQWVQEEHRVFITGVFTHIFPIAHLYSKGMCGWAAIHESVFANLPYLQVGDHGHAWLEKPTDEDMD